MRSVADLFRKFGGSTEVGRAIGRRQTASEMKRRASIPIEHWPTLIAAARAKGIELDEATLVRIHLSSAEGDASSDQAASHAA